MNAFAITAHIPDEPEPGSEFDTNDAENARKFLTGGMMMFLNNKELVWDKIEKLLRELPTSVHKTYVDIQPPQMSPI